MKQPFTFPTQDLTSTALFLILLNTTTYSPTYCSEFIKNLKRSLSSTTTITRLQKKFGHKKLRSRRRDNLLRMLCNFNRPPTALNSQSIGSLVDQGSLIKTEFDQFDHYSINTDFLLEQYGAKYALFIAKISSYQLRKYTKWIAYQDIEHAPNRYHLIPGAATFIFKQDLDPEALYHKAIAFIFNKHGRTILHFAPMLCANEVRILLNAGADPNARDNNESTPLFYVSCLSDSLDTLKALLDAGANINATNIDGNTPLVLACQNDNSQFVAMLLQAGANPNITNKDGKTPLHFALTGIGSQYTRMVRALLSYGANPHIMVKGETREMPAFWYVIHHSAHWDKIQSFLDAGIDPNDTEYYARAALHTLASMETSDSQNHLEALKVLLEAPADPNVLDHFGKNPLDYCSTNAPHHFDHINLLLQFGAVARQETKEKILLEAQKYDRNDIVEILSNMNPIFKPQIIALEKETSL